MSTRYQDYDPFAWLYHHYWGTEFHGQIIQVLDRLVLRLLHPGAAVLDLCCGDGRVAAVLHSRGYRVTGLDGSENMLGFAKARVPDADFVLADAREFSFPASFDAVISTFDSLNHVLDTEELGLVFRNVATSLRPGGYFAFDLNREKGYTELWVEMTGIVDDGAVSVARSDYDTGSGIATCNITLFQKEDKLWSRSDFELTQKYHPHDQVCASLRQAGFSHVGSFDAVEDLDMRGRIGMHRTFYLARKGNRK